MTFKLGFQEGEEENIISLVGRGRSFKVERMARESLRDEKDLVPLFLIFHLPFFFPLLPSPFQAVVSQACLVQEEIFLFGKFNKLPLSLY